MERREGPQTPYEVYCYNCRVTFAAGTRNCIHCGQRLGKSRTPPDPTGATAPPTLDDLDTEAIDTSPLRRAGGISLWVLIAVGAAIARMCGEG